MRSKTFALASATILSLSGAARAQTATGGSAKRDMNNPGSVKSNSEKTMERGDMPATTGTVTGSGTSHGDMHHGAVPAAGTSPNRTTPAR